MARIRPVRNEFGGLDYNDSAGQRRAKKADLVTFPPEVTGDCFSGARCRNCSFFTPHFPEVMIEDVSDATDEQTDGFCSNPILQQDVNGIVQCCSGWDAPGVLRNFEV